MVDLLSIAEAIGSSGLAVIGYNAWVSKRTSRTAAKSELRNEKREPLVVTSMELGNATKVNDLLRAGLDALENQNRTAEEFFRATKGELEDKVESLTDENKRIRAVMITETLDHKELVQRLREEISALKIELRILKAKD